MSSAHEYKKHEDKGDPEYSQGFTQLKGNPLFIIGYSYTDLLEAYDNCSIYDKCPIEKFTSEYCDYFNKKDIHGDTMLHTVVRHSNNKDLVEILLKNYVDINMVSNYDLLTPLDIANKKGKKELASFLVTKGATGALVTEGVHKGAGVASTASGSEMSGAKARVSSNPTGNEGVGSHAATPCGITKEPAVLPVTIVNTAALDKKKKYEGTGVASTVGSSEISGAAASNPTGGEHVGFHTALVIGDRLDGKITAKGTEVKVVAESYRGRRTLSGKLFQNRGLTL